MQKHRQFCPVSHYFQKCFLSIFVRKVILPVNRQLNIFDAVFPDPGYLFVVPVSLTMFKGRAYIYNCGNMIFIEQTGVIHPSWLTAGIKDILLDNAESFDMKMPYQ